MTSSKSLSRISRSKFKAAGDCPSFSESARKNGTVPFSPNGFKTACKPIGGALLLCLLAALAGCDRQRSLPELGTPLVVRVVGRDFYWRFIFPGRDGALGTDDDITKRQDLHVPLNHPVKLELTSDDYVYSFRAPELGLLESAIPELLFTIDFVPEQPGRYELEVDPMCGFAFAHSNDVMGMMVVEPAEDVRAWLAAAAP